MGQCLALDSDTLQSLIGSSPQVNPQISTSSKTNVSPCRGSGITFYQNLTQAIFNSYLINPNIGEKPIKVCDTLGVIQNFLPLAKTEKYNGKLFKYSCFEKLQYFKTIFIICCNIATSHYLRHSYKYKQAFIKSRVLIISDSCDYSYIVFIEGTVNGKFFT